MRGKSVEVRDEEEEEEEREERQSQRERERERTRACSRVESTGAQVHSTRMNRGVLGG